MRGDKTENIHTRVSKTTKIKLLKYAANKDISEAEVIRQALQKFLRNIKIKTR